ncbi:MAG: peptidase S8, partial [Chitinophagaceae bacterium]
MGKLVNLTFAACVLAVTGGFAQAQQDPNPRNGEVPKGWHLKDKATEGFHGISLDKAYDFIKGKNLKSKTVVVAVIDSGIDTLHEDLKEVLWRNPKEIPGNGKDDDGNGYIDDVYGWNFIGGKDGSNVTKDTYEGARVYHKLKAKFGDKQLDSTT